ncbi:MAG: hypothetical protein QF464_11890, partial [Myxococcota bacterium]|nr:hypothetical protein [Myxococcota bacterium]
MGARTVIAWMAVALNASPAASRVRTDAPVHLVTSEIPDARLITVRLDLGLGHGAETGRSAGTSAAVAAWLLRGPSSRLEPGQLELRAQRAGLDVTTEVGWHTTSLTLTGPAERAALAGALVADRLEPGSAPDAVIEALQEAIWTGHEETLRGVVGPMGDVVQTAVAALEPGRTAFSSRHAATRLRAGEFRRRARFGLT